MSLGHFIQKKLRERGATLYFLAKATQISYPYLLAIEKGQRNNPSYEKLKKIAAALEIDIQLLLQAGGFETAGKVVSATVSDVGPTRIPILPWAWFLETEDIAAAILEHQFRQFHYTSIKKDHLLALTLQKPLDFFEKETLLVLDYQPVVENGALWLVKRKEGVALYQLSSWEEGWVGISKANLGEMVKLDQIKADASFVGKVVESVVRYGG